jgi:hypothetical protein
MVHNFGTILPHVVAVKSIKNCLHKICSILALKMLLKLNAGLSYLQTFLESQYQLAKLATF